MKTGIIKAALFLLNVIYAILKIFPRDGRVVMISRQSNSVTLDFLLLKKQLEADYPQIKTVILTKRLESGLKSKVGYVFHMLRQMYHIARAGAVVLDSYCIAASVLKHKQGLFILQIWHAIGNMKKFGRAILDQEEGSSAEIAEVMRMHKNYDLVAISNMDFAEDYARGFGITREQIIEAPLPRADLLKNAEYAAEQKRRLTEKYPILRERKNILYCPTFRKDDSRVQSAIEQLANSFDPQKYNFIVCLHPLCPRYEFRGAILQPEESSFEMLFAADALISDYSSIVYEAGALNIPIYCYAYDWEEYLGKREINIDLERDFPGGISKTPEELLDMIEREHYDHDALRSFTQKNIAYPAEGCAGKLSKLILEHII